MTAKVYGELVPGLVVNGKAVTGGMVDERKVRAAAGLTLILGAVAFVYAYFAKFYRPIEMITIFFFLDFVLRVSAGLKYSMTGQVARLLTWGRKPEWVSAKPKRFAWSIGIVMSLAMVYITNTGIRGALPLVMCMICMIFMWLEAVLGLCLGCEVYAFLQRRGWIGRDPEIEVCADGVCAIEPSAQ